MLVLHSVPPAFGQKTASSYCLKAMFLLNMAGLEWRPEYSVFVKNAPRGKFPVLIDGDVIVPDSTDIARYLERVHGCDFTPGLSPEQKAQGHAISRMMEEHVAQALTYDRWVLDPVWPHLKPYLFIAVPETARDEVAEGAREKVKQLSYAQGMGRLTPEEVVARISEDFDALETLLGDKPFLFSDRPVYADASTAPFLISLLSQPVETRLQCNLKSRPDLVAYAERVKAALGGEQGAAAAA
jgi:glutathione S-transferase